MDDTLETYARDVFGSPCIAESNPTQVGAGRRNNNADEAARFTVAEIAVTAVDRTAIMKLPILGASARNSLAAALGSAEPWTITISAPRNVVDVLKNDKKRRIGGGGGGDDSSDDGPELDTTQMNAR